MTKKRPMVVRPPGRSTGTVTGPLREERRGGSYTSQNSVSRVSPYDQALTSHPKNQGNVMLGKLFVGAFKLLFAIIGAGVLISIISVVVVVVRETWIK